MTEATKAPEVLEGFAVVNNKPIEEGGLTLHHPNPYDKVSITPMELLQIAVNKDADIGKLEALMNLQLKWEANEARKAFVEAMNAFKKNPPEIIKNKLVAYKDVSYKHATLDQVCDKITESLSTHGISHRWRIEQSDGLIRVTCILTHDKGHSEETTLSGAPDNTGSKNAIQAISSTVTYLERYTLLAATGLAAANGDNDGQGAPKWEKLQEYLDSMVTAPNIKVLDDTFKAGYKEAVALKNTQAMLALITAKDARKAILQKEETV
jgi:hypothetical protein